MKLSITTVLLLCACCHLLVQVQIGVNVDVNHKVGGQNSMKRAKWMILYSSQQSREWDDVMDSFHYIIDDLDTYFGRETVYLKRVPIA